MVLKNASLAHLSLLPRNARAMNPARGSQLTESARTRGGAAQTALAKSRHPIAISGGDVGGGCPGNGRGCVSLANADVGGCAVLARPNRNRGRVGDVRHAGAGGCAPALHECERARDAHEDAARLLMP